MIGENVEIRMPDFSELSEANPSVSKWYIKVGDSVKLGDVIAEVDVGIATVELESYTEGEVVHIATKENIELKIDDLLCIIGEKEVEKSTVKPVERSNFSSESLSPDGAELVLMPKMSKKMIQGKISLWKFNLGDYITAGDVIAEVETDKATMELESYVSGFLLYKGAKQNSSVRINEIVAVIGEKESEYQSLVGNYNQKIKKDNSNSSLLEEYKQNKKSGFLNRLWDFLTP